MIRYNLLKWCDEHISYLKSHGIEFSHEIPQLPHEYLFTDRPSAVSTFAYRNDIPEKARANALLTYFMLEDKLWPRLAKIDDDIEILREYGGVAGFDLSPCIGMLRPRQLLSILVNAIHACYLGIHGIKILPNYRAGDFGTLCAADFFPDDCSFIVGNLGCTNTEFKAYGDYQLDIILRRKRPEVLFVYGSMSQSNAARLISRNHFEVISFPDRRNRVRNNSKSYRYYMAAGEVNKIPYADATKGGNAYGC